LRYSHLKILQIHNEYGKKSGEETVVEAQAKVLKDAGHEVRQFVRSSAEIYTMRYGKIVAFISSLYGTKSIRYVREIYQEFSPDIVHIHNLYPLISPAILPVIRRAGIPIVMTVHNYRLICPNGLFYYRNGICEMCSGGREWYCVLNNCEQSIPKSVGYALRNSVARMLRLYTDNVDAFLCLTEFQKQKLIENGFSEDSCYILPNFTETDFCEKKEQALENKGVLFLGRLNRQKGVDILLKAAKLCPSVPIFLAGSPDPHVVNVDRLPPNVRWLGVVDGEGKQRVFNKSLALVFTSRSYEGFPMVFLEAMQHGIPVIAPCRGGIPEIIRDGINGWLFKSDDPESLARFIQNAYDHPDTAFDYGQNGKKIAQEEYCADSWYRGYMQIIRKIEV